MTHVFETVGILPHMVRGVVVHTHQGAGIVLDQDGTYAVPSLTCVHFKDVPAAMRYITLKNNQQGVRT